MSNRQARREQSKGARQQRPNRPTRPTPSAKKPSSGGPDFLSRPYLLAVAGLVIILAAVLVWYSSRSSGTSNTTQQLLTAQADFPTDMVKDNTVGDPNAPLKLTEYEDFQCPICLNYTASTEPTIVKEYVKTGKVQLTFKHLPILGSESVQAAIASVCAQQQGKFWDMEELLYLTEAKAGQDTTEKTQAGRFSDSNLKQFASQIGLDATKFNTCFTSPDTLKTVLAQQNEATALGIKGTPGFTLNGQPLSQGNMSMDEWRKALDDAYTKLTTTPTATTTAAASPAATTSATAAASASPAAAGSATPAPSASAAASPTATKTP
ncbi:MAG TPA: thioredoxin domain-containing protein [Tepidiformaceae bacterium]